MLMDIFLLCLLIFISLLLLSVAWSSVSLAPFVPTRTKDLERIGRLAGLKEGDVFYELGCGSGRVSLYMVRHFGARAVGIEATWPLWALCELKRLFLRQKNLEFRFGNLFREDLSSADVIYFFGMPDSIKKRLKEKLARDLKDGAKVISYAFKVPGWAEERMDKPGKKDVALYLYLR